MIYGLPAALFSAEASRAEGLPTVRFLCDAVIKMRFRDLFVQ